MEKTIYDEIEQTLVKEEWMEDTPQRVLEPDKSLKIHQVSVDPAVKCGELFLRGKDRSFTFICAICSNPFDSLESFGQHIELHIENGKALATECYQQDPLVGRLLFPRLTLVQENEPPIELIDIKREEDCEDEPPGIEGKYKLHEKLGFDQNSIQSENHDGSSNERSIFPCLKCDSMYTSLRALQTHVKKKHEEKLPSRLFDSTEKTDHGLEESSSDISSKSSQRELDRNIDETELSSRTEKKFSCKFCDRAYTNIKTIRRHVKVNHGEEYSDANGTRCRYCSKTFSTQAECNAHVESEHPGTKKYSCPHCPKLFRHPNNLKDHIYTHTGEKPLKCHDCGKRFARKSDLNVHIRQHKKIKNHTCTICTKSFVTSFEKKQHQKTHTGEKPHQCEECGVRFASLQWLKGHLAKHRNIKNYKCDMCDKAYFTKSMLKEHIPSHSSERPYSCKICGKSYPRKTALYVHQEVHSAVKKFVCNVCDKAFAQRSGLYYHRRSNACGK